MGEETTNQKAWQEDARKAFDWINRVYEQTQVMLDDAEAYLEEDGWKASCGEGLGGVAMASDLRRWPFVYFKALAATPDGVDPSAATGRAVFVGVVFYDTRRVGPWCVAGCVDWTSATAQCDHWALLAAVGGAVPKWAEGAFEIGAGPVHVATATSKAAKVRPGVGDVRWFEVPLGTISSAERLRDVLEAAKALTAGDETQARELATAGLGGS